MAELSLWLDSYDDIYSDFDSRHYLNRRISEDFLDELRASMKFKPEPPDAIVLLLPARLRDDEVEKAIVSSIKDQIGEREQMLTAKAGKKRSRGILMLVLGLVVMVVDSLITFKTRSGYFVTLMRVIMEPAGWFLIWNGLDFVLYEYRAIVKENAFYKSVAALSIHFKDL